MFCIKCGKELDKDVSFCSNCGEPIPEKNKKEEADNKEVKENFEREERIYTQPSIPVKQNEQTAPTAIASLVIGIISFAFCFLFSVITLPLSIAGFCLGIATKQKSAVKIIGLILNILSALISILIFILFGAFIITLFIDVLKNSNNYQEPEIHEPTEVSIVEGDWYCKDIDGVLNNGSYVFFLSLDDDYKFTYNSFSGESRPYYEGSYTLKESQKASSPKYQYYKLNLTMEKYYGDLQEFESNYEIGVDYDNDEAILINNATNVQYKCTR